MPPLPAVAIHTPLPGGRAGEFVRAYHERTKHRLSGFAQGPQTLDWDAQPAPFRHFAGAARVMLPLLEELAPDDPRARAFARPFAWPVPAPSEPVPWSLATLGVLLHVSLGLTAHKSLGPDRWALRANPSSGNLHPVEAYVVARGLPWLDDGVYHYAPDDHALERLAHWTRAPAQGAGLFVALSCVQWRETWKYGERAFRYCQLDVGHALGALGVAAAALGSTLRAQTDVPADELAALLGLDRPGERRRSELEEPEVLLRISHPSLPPADASAREVLSEDGLCHGAVEPSTIDPRPLYLWPIIERVAHETRQAPGEPAWAPGGAPTEPMPVADPPVAPPPADGAPTLASVVLGRRSAQRFDVRHTLGQAVFLRLLQALASARTGAHRALETNTSLDVVLFVHRVEGLVSGLYLLPRAASGTAALQAQLCTGLDAEPVGGAFAPVGLERLARVPPRELMRRARLLHCQQDIASSGCFALGMIAPLARLHSEPAVYRTVHRQAGQLGQALYLAAEAEGLRGTGIGCFLDDEVHALLGLSGSEFQTVYHFTVGRALVDPRIETTPAYPGRSRAWRAPSPP